MRGLLLTHSTRWNHTTFQYRAILKKKCAYLSPPLSHLRPLLPLTPSCFWLIPPFFVFQVPQVFELVEAFVSSAVPGSAGRLFLLDGKPGGELFCLEFNSAVRCCRRVYMTVLSKSMIGASCFAHQFAEENSCLGVASVGR